MSSPEVLRNFTRAASSIVSSASKSRSMFEKPLQWRLVDTTDSVPDTIRQQEEDTAYGQTTNVWLLLSDRFCRKISKMSSGVSQTVSPHRERQAQLKCLKASQSFVLVLLQRHERKEESLLFETVCIKFLYLKRFSNGSHFSDPNSKAQRLTRSLYSW